MRPVLLFAGTREGRELAARFSAAGVPATVCTATGYGGTLLPEGGTLRVHAGRLDREGIAALMREGNFSFAVDATHPYAAEATRNIRAAAGESGTVLFRLLRESGGAEGCTAVPDVKAAARLLNEREGKALLATGSKELAVFTEVSDYQERLYPRMLPLPEVVKGALELGFPAAHLICMQGPLGMEPNEALMRQFDLSILVTKETGRAGGFPEKLEAARRQNAEVIVIGRPPEEEGLSMEELLPLLEKKLGVSLGAGEEMGG